MISPVDIWNSRQTRLGSEINNVSLRKWQQDKLESVLDYANNNTIFYRTKLDTCKELTKLPFTLPSDVAADPLAFLAMSQSSVARVSTLANSGTTSLRKRIFFSEGDLERTKDFFSAGMSTMTKRGDNALILISNRTENSLGSLLSESLSRIGVSAEISGLTRSAEEAVKDSEGADCLIGMPSELLYMSCIAPYLRPGSVLLAADIAPQAVADRIRENWGCDVFAHYGHTEFGYGCAVDCSSHEGLHLRHADLIFEIINPETGQPVTTGERGEIVITTLSNEAMPLIRYRTGHISRIIETPCKCGSVLPRLGRIEGRYNNLVPVSEKGTLSICQIDNLVFADRAVRSMDAMYDRVKKTLTLLIDSSAPFNEESLKEVIPDEVKTSIIYSRYDPFGNRGKRKIKVL
jgi:phenylacetate-CoA ligase